MNIRLNNQFEITGFKLLNYFTSSYPGFEFASAIGDFNKDGYNDFLLNSLSTVYIIYGGPTHPQFIGFDLNDPKLPWCTAMQSSYLGAPAGDWNGDGYQDVFLIAQIDDNPVSSASVIVLYGQANVPSFDFLTQNYPPISGVEIQLNPTELRWVGSVGDINGDGAPDFGFRLTDKLVMIYGKPYVEPQTTITSEVLGVVIGFASLIVIGGFVIFWMKWKRKGCFKVKVPDWISSEMSISTGYR